MIKLDLTDVDCDVIFVSDKRTSANRDITINPEDESDSLEKTISEQSIDFEVSISDNVEELNLQGTSFYVKKETKDGSSTKKTKLSYKIGKELPQTLKLKMLNDDQDDLEPLKARLLSRGLFLESVPKLVVDEASSSGFKDQSVDRVLVFPKDKALINKEIKDKKYAMITCSLDGGSDENALMSQFDDFCDFINQVKENADQLRVIDPISYAVFNSKGNDSLFESGIALASYAVTKLCLTDKFNYEENAEEIRKKAKKIVVNDNSSLSKSVVVTGTTDVNTYSNLFEKDIYSEIDNLSFAVSSEEKGYSVLPLTNESEFKKVNLEFTNASILAQLSGVSDSKLKKGRYNAVKGVDYIASAFLSDCAYLLYNGMNDYTSVIPNTFKFPLFDSMVSLGQNSKDSSQLLFNFVTSKTNGSFSNIIESCLNNAYVSQGIEPENFKLLGEIPTHMLEKDIALMYSYIANITKPLNLLITANEFKDFFGDARKNPYIDDINSPLGSFEYPKTYDDLAREYVESLKISIQSTDIPEWSVAYNLSVSDLADLFKSGLSRKSKRFKGGEKSPIEIEIESFIIHHDAGMENLCQSLGFNNARQILDDCYGGSTAQYDKILKTVENNFPESFEKSLRLMILCIIGIFNRSQIIRSNLDKAKMGMMRVDGTAPIYGLDAQLLNIFSERPANDFDPTVKRDIKISSSVPLYESIVNGKIDKSVEDIVSEKVINYVDVETNERLTGTVLDAMNQTFTEQEITLLENSLAKLKSNKDILPVFNVPQNLKSLSCERVFSIVGLGNLGSVDNISKFIKEKILLKMMANPVGFNSISIRNKLGNEVTLMERSENSEIFTFDQNPSWKSPSLTQIMDNMTVSINLSDKTITDTFINISESKRSEYENLISEEINALSEEKEFIEQDINEILRQAENSNYDQIMSLVEAKVPLMHKVIKRANNINSLLDDIKNGLLETIEVEPKLSEKSEKVKQLLSDYVAKSESMSGKQLKKLDKKLDNDIRNIVKGEFFNSYSMMNINNIINDAKDFAIDQINEKIDLMKDFDTFVSRFIADEIVLKYEKMVGIEDCISLTVELTDDMSEMDSINLSYQDNYKLDQFIQSSMIGKRFLPLSSMYQIISFAKLVSSKFLITDQPIIFKNEVGYYCRQDSCLKESTGYRGNAYYKPSKEKSPEKHNKLVLAVRRYNIADWGVCIGDSSSHFDSMINGNYELFTMFRPITDPYNEEKREALLFTEVNFSNKSFHVKESKARGNQPPIQITKEFRYPIGHSLKNLITWDWKTKQVEDMLSACGFYTYLFKANESRFNSEKVSTANVANDGYIYICLYLDLLCKAITGENLFSPEMKPTGYEEICNSLIKSPDFFTVERLSENRVDFFNSLMAGSGSGVSTASGLGKTMYEILNIYSEDIKTEADVEKALEFIRNHEKVNDSRLLSMLLEDCSKYIDPIFNKGGTSGNIDVRKSGVTFWSKWFDNKDEALT